MSTLTEHDIVSMIEDATADKYGPDMGWQQLNMLPPTPDEFEESLTTRSGGYDRIQLETEISGDTARSAAREWVDFVLTIAEPMESMGTLLCHCEESPFPFNHVPDEADAARYYRPHVDFQTLRRGRGYRVSIVILNAKR